MNHERLLPPDGGPRRFPILWRVALIAALIAMALGVFWGGEGGPVRAQWPRDTNAIPLQGDVLYRAGVALQGAERLRKSAPSLDPDYLIESGIGFYERIALRRDSPNAPAMLRLAIIYSKRGYPDEGLKLLEQLVLLDEARAPLYLTISAVYDVEPVAADTLRPGVAIIEAADGWVSRMALADCRRRLGDTQAASDAEAVAARADRRFAIALAIIGLIYAALALLGAVLLVRFVWVALFRIPTPVRAAPLSAPWGALDGVEVGALLAAATAILGALSATVVRTMPFASDLPWAAACLTLLSYVASCAAALILIRHRAKRLGAWSLRALGIDGRPQIAGLAHGICGYAIIVALLLAGVVTLRGPGLEGVFGGNLSVTGLIGGARSFPAIAIYFALVCILAPVLEELIFRGFIYAGFRRRLDVPFAVALNAAFFGAAHMALGPGGMLMVAAIGVVLAFLYERTRSLWPGIAAHALHNCLAFSLIIAVMS